MSTNAALIAKLESAKEGSRDLSDGVLLALGWEYNPAQPTSTAFDIYEWKGPNGERLVIGDRRPSPTENLQDAVDLVTEGWGTNKAAFLHGAMYQRCIGDIPDEKLAIFVCICILKALETEAAHG